MNDNDMIRASVSEGADIFLVGNKDWSSERLDIFLQYSLDTALDNLVRDIDQNHAAITNECWRLWEYYKRNSK